MASAAADIYFNDGLVSKNSVEECVGRFGALLCIVFKPARNNIRATRNTILLIAIFVLLA